MSAKPLTVGDLKRALADVPDRVKVELARDAEGNDFKSLVEVTSEDGSEPSDDVVIFWPAD